MTVNFISIFVFIFIIYNTFLNHFGKMSSEVPTFIMCKYICNLKQEQCNNTTSRKYCFEHECLDCRGIIPPFVRKAGNTVCLPCKNKNKPSMCAEHVGEPETEFGEIPMCGKTIQPGCVCPNHPRGKKTKCLM